MPTKEILNTYTLLELRKEVELAQITGYGKASKEVVINKMMEKPYLFKHLKGKGKEEGKVGPTVAILNSLTLGVLRKEIAKHKLVGYQKMTKPVIIAYIMANKHRFPHLGAQSTIAEENKPPKPQLEVEEMKDSRFHPDGYNLIVTDAIKKLRKERFALKKSYRLSQYRDILWLGDGKTINPDTGKILSHGGWVEWREKHGFWGQDREPLAYDDIQTVRHMMAHRHLSSPLKIRGENYIRVHFDNSVWRDKGRGEGYDLLGTYDKETHSINFNERFKNLREADSSEEEEEDEETEEEVAEWRRKELERMERIGNINTRDKMEDPEEERIRIQKKKWSEMNIAREEYFKKQDEDMKKRGENHNERLSRWKAEHRAKKAQKIALEMDSIRTRMEDTE